MKPYRKLVAAIVGTGTMAAAPYLTPWLDAAGVPMPNFEAFLTQAAMAGITAFGVWAVKNEGIT